MSLAATRQLDPRPAPRPARRGRARGADLLRGVLLLAALAGLGLWLRGWRQQVAAGEFATIRTDRARLLAGTGWVDPRWEEELGALLAELDDVRADDRAAVEALAERVAELSFVAACGVPTVLWPDGLRLDLRLREPVACVHVGRHYLGVAADATVLSGNWPAPPARDTGFLPVLDLRQDGGAPRRDVVPGVTLEEPAALDGLAVALSLWRELAPDDLARLGRCAIDARRAPFASVEEPGVVVRLEGRRSILFGRSPNYDAPGELPVALKWDHVARALALLEPDPARVEAPEGIDWDQIDVRWDEADLHVREEGEPTEEGR